MRIKLYAMLRDYAGSEELVLESEGPVSTDELIKALMEKAPGLRDIRGVIEEEASLLLLVNGRPVKKGELIPPDALVEILPPAAGG
jgi:molybdopterin converting factor small subunit